MAIQFASIVYGLGKALGGIIGEATSERVNDAIGIPIWEISKRFNVQEIITNPIKAIEEGDSSETTGITPKGIKDILTEFVNAMVMLAPILSREIVDELIGEMLQEGLSNAIQTSVGGALQTILNTRRGGFPSFQDLIREYSNDLTIHDPNLLGLVFSAIGLNLPVTGTELAVSANRAIEDYIRDYLAQAHGLINHINTYTVGHITNAIVSLNVVLNRAITLPLELAMIMGDVARRVAEEHLARLNELEDSLEGVKKYWDSGIVRDQTLILTEMEKINAELDALMSLYYEYKSSYEGLLPELLSTLETECKSAIDSLKDAFALAYKKLVESVNVVNDDSFVRTYKSRLLEVISSLQRKISAYREVNWDGYQFNTNVRFE